MKAKTADEVFTEIVLEIFKVSGMLNTEGDKMTEEFGLSSARWKVLGAISLSEELLTVPQIGRVMGQSRQATQRLVDIMCKDGLLKLTDNPNHKRAKHVELTVQGEQVFDQLDKKNTPWATAAASKLTAQELETTLSTLQKMSEHFDC